MNTTTHVDHTTDEQQAAAWSLIEHLQNDLAHKLRLHEAGKNVDPLQVLKAAKIALERKETPAAEEPEDEQTVFLAREILESYWEQVTKQKNTVTTGFGGLNAALSGGIESKRLLILLGAPNTGKTTLAHQMADHIASSGRPVLYVTSEDTPLALIAKTLARHGAIDYTPILKGWDKYEKRIKEVIAEQLERMSSDRLCYLDATSSIDMLTIRETAAAHFARFPGDEQAPGGKGVIFVDYLQRIARAVKRKRNLAKDLREVVTDVGEELKDLSKSLDCAVIAIAAQNRGGYTRGEGGNSLSSAKESGDLEYTADVLMALVEDTERKKTAPHLTPISLYIDKNRQGPRGKKIELDFYAARQRFTEVADL